MSAVNKPLVSGPVVWLYGALVVFLGALGGFFGYMFLRSPRVGMVVGLVVVLGVEVVVLLILVSIYGTSYVLTERELVLKASVLVGGTKTVRLDTVRSVERTLIPFGFRLFGASFYGGYYYFPGLGRAFVVMTNFRDGVLIKTVDCNYVITPRNPEAFIESIKRAVGLGEAGADA
jgi:hypothetical protein